MGKILEATGFSLLIINLLFPPEMSRETGHWKVVTQDVIRKRFEKMQKEEDAIREERKRKEEVEKQAFLKRNSFPDVKEENCFYLDISSKTNMAFRDELAGDRKGGWTDQGPNDLSEFPVGDQVFSGVPFHIINPAKNRNKSCIILWGKPRQYFPENVAGIEVNRRAKNLYFLYTVAWGGGDLCFKYIVHLEDGEKIEIPIRFWKEVYDWWGAKEVPQAKIAWIGKNLVCNKIAVYCYRWQNPKPELKVKKVDIISAKKEVVPGIIAITGEE